MSKFRVPDKTNLAPLALPRRLPKWLLVGISITAATACWAKEKKPRQNQPNFVYIDAIDKAKGQLSLGNRVQAIELIDKAIASARTKKEARDAEAKRALFAEQFLTSDAFQKYQVAKGLSEAERWEECLKELEPVGSGDQNNLLVLRQVARCQMGTRQYERASQAYQQILKMVPKDVSSALGLAEIDLDLLRPQEGLARLGAISRLDVGEAERFAILKSQLLEASGRSQEAVVVLKEDQERYLEHIEVMFRLGSMYSKVEGHDWQARKMFSLFLTRCKRMKESELRARHLSDLVPDAQKQLESLDRRLGV